MIVEVNSQNRAFLQCFSSGTRIKMIELLNNHPMNIKELASSLDLSSAIVTKHVQKLEEAGIITCQKNSNKRGSPKICSLSLDQVSLQLKTQKQPANAYSISIPVGQYSSFEVKPTCGLVSKTKRIGMIDDPRYFADPEHVQASHIWFGSGWIEYQIPNFLLSNQLIRSLEVTLEVCSEAPHYNENWPSDISFYINEHFIGMWTCPGDFGENKGVYTPDWWNGGTQHGLLKSVTIDQEGSFIDGKQMSEVNILDLDLHFDKDIFLKIASLETAKNCGGISLFGKSFGNYNQDIQVTMRY